MPAPALFRERFNTPIGEFLLITDKAGALRAANWLDSAHRLRLLRQADLVLVDRSEPSAVRRGLEAYLAGDLTAIDSLAVATGGTAFQQSVWEALRALPPGSASTYSALAARIGRPSATRAVGLANGSNPVSVVVPCHRLIGSNGALTGYGGGLSRKAWLLAHEGVVI